MAKARAVQGEHTLFNPLSYWFILPQPGFKPPNVLIIDEAHRLEGMLMDLGSAELSITRYGSPLSPNLVDVCAWLKENAFKLEKEVALLLRANDVDRALHASTQALRVRTILQCIEAEPQCFHIYRETRELKRKKETYTVIKPLSVPLRILRQFFNCQKLVLMSATLPRPDVESLSLGRAIAYLDMPNPIPAVQRPILYRPAAVAMNFKTETKDMVEWIRGHLQPGVNTIVHVTYAWASKLKMYFPEALTHTPETKNKVLDKFKRSRGALWLAAGCAEGVDLPGDECRLNLIPMLYRQNISDPWVKKRMTIEGGNFWYNLEVLKATIQQTGRSTRGLTDKSTAIIGDPRFPRLIQELKEHVPVSFLDAIDWRTRSDDPGFDEGEDCLLSPVRKI
jgi:Rad3-related DNA helicase